MQEQRVRISFMCESEEKLDGVRQWLEEALKETVAASSFFNDKGTGTVTFGPYTSSQDLELIMSGIIRLCYSKDAPVDVTSSQIYQRRKKK